MEQGRDRKRMQMFDFCVLFFSDSFQRRYGKNDVFFGCSCLSSFAPDKKQRSLPVTTKDGPRRFAPLQKWRVRMVHHEQR